MIQPIRALAVLSFCLLSVALVLATATAGAAQVVPDTLRRDTVYRIEPIAVRAVRPSTTVGGVSALEVRLDSVRFQPAPLLEHVLRELPLVQVRTNSRGEAQLAIRGAEERQIAVLLDGVPLTLGWDHRTDLSVIPLTAAQSVRLVRGMSSVLHGPNVLGGVVEIGLASVPVTGPEPLSVAGGVDQRGGYSVGVLSGAAIELDEGRVVVRGGVGRRERDGLLAPDHVTAVYPALEGDALRVNSDLEHTDAFLAVRYAHQSGPWVSASGSGFLAERGVPPELTESGPRLWRQPDATRFLGILAAGSGPIDNGPGEGELNLNVGLDLGSNDIRGFLQPTNPSDPGLEADAFYETVDEAEVSDDRTITVRLIGKQRLGSVELRAAGTYGDVRHDEVVTVAMASGSPDRFPAEYRQRLWSVAGELDLPFDIARLGPFTGGRIGGGVAYDGADTPETGGTVEGRTMSEWGGRLGASVTTGSGKLLLHTAVSRRGRFPALREMYSIALGRFEPNPGLRPEILTAVEGGFTSKLDRYDLQVVGFHQRLDDAIVRGAPPAGSSARFQRINRDRIRSIGLEVLAGYSVGRFALESEFTVQDVEVIEPGSPGVRAEYEPELIAGLGGTVPLFAGIEAVAEVEYLGSQYCSTPVPGAEDYEELDASTRADVQLARTFHLDRTVATFQRLGLELAFDNLTDAAIYDQCGLPQPGRTLRLQFRLD